MIQVCNSKAVGAEGAELGARRVRCPVQNVILQIFCLGKARPAVRRRRVYVGTRAS